MVVTCNYRLGLLGLHYLGDLAGSAYTQGNAALADWPRYDLTHRTTMLLNEVSQVVDDPQAEILPLWETVS